MTSERAGLSVDTADNTIHVYPVTEVEHRLDGFCWCQPTYEDEVNGRIYVHRRSLDSPHREEPDA